MPGLRITSTIFYDTQFDRFLDTKIAQAYQTQKKSFN